MMDLNEIIECASCEKEIYYGNSYDSLFLTDVAAKTLGGELVMIPKRVCSECHEKELKQMHEIEERTKEAEERKHIESCENCRFRSSQRDEEPCKFCKLDKPSLFRQRSQYDEARAVIGEMRQMLSNLEHFIEEIEEDGQTAGACGSDSRSDDRDRSCVCTDGSGE